MHTSASSLILVVALALKKVAAGAGCNANLCVYFSSAPSEPFNVTWDACGSATHCMYCPSQQKWNVTVQNAGVTCLSLGKVESKSSSSGGDVCASDKSYWEVGYNAGAYSGYAVTNWRGGGIRHNYIELVDGKYTAGTGVCGTASECDGTSTDWDAGSSPDKYVVFTPKAKSSGIPLESADEMADNAKQDLKM